MTPIRYLPTPNTMDMLPPHAGLAGLRAAGLGGFANLRDETGPEGGVRLLPTLDGSHPMAAHTARLVGADPGRIPARRIDYMFSEGWNHGRRGGWTGDVSLTDTGWSDHMLMEAAILV